jgi:DNA-binding Lrp family transcriptional regulator
MSDSIELSPVDLRILRLLQNDARITNKDLAAARSASRRRRAWTASPGCGTPA